MDAINGMVKQTHKIGAPCLSCLYNYVGTRSVKINYCAGYYYYISGCKIIVRWNGFIAGPCCQLCL